MKLLNPLLLLCQISIAAFAISVWPTGLEIMREDSSNCSAPIGHPEILELGGQVYHYQYDAKGRVISRRGEIEELRFQYVWQHDHPIHITRIYGLAGQPDWVKFEWHFIYNSNDDLVYARDEDGREARYGYNDQGDLLRVKSLNSALMEVAYDPVCHKPSRLSQTGIGSVAINYDRECENGEYVYAGDEFLYRFISSLKLMDQPNMDVFH